MQQQQQQQHQQHQQQAIRASYIGAGVYHSSEQSGAEQRYQQSGPHQISMVNGGVLKSEQDQSENVPVYPRYIAIWSLPLYFR